MRILQFLITSLIIMIAVAGLSFLTLREGLLFWGSLKVENALGELKFISKNQNVYIQQCKLKGNTNQTNVIRRLQLRFTSPQRFVTEVVCDQFPNDPIAIKSDSLPMFVMKKAGFSGIIWGDNPSGVELELWGRQKSVGVVAQEVRIQKTYEAGVLQPPTTCSGFSQVCCQAETSQGIGSVNTQASDCSQNCYVACQSRPIVLSFTSDPFYDQSTRILTIERDTTVTFSFVVSSMQELPPLVIISFGDGQQETLADFTGQFTHTYACLTSSCSFTASVEAEDAAGISSTPTPLSKMTILIH